MKTEFKFLSFKQFGKSILLFTLFLSWARVKGQEELPTTLPIICECPSDEKLKEIIKNRVMATERYDSVKVSGDCNLPFLRSTCGVIVAGPEGRRPREECIGQCVYNPTPCPIIGYTNGEPDTFGFGREVAPGRYEINIPCDDYSDGTGKKYGSNGYNSHNQFEQISTLKEPGNSFDILPNPIFNDDNIKLSIYATVGQKANLFIYDIIGRPVEYSLNQPFYLEKGKNEVDIDIPNVKPGSYMVILLMEKTKELLTRTLVVTAR